MQVSQRGIDLIAEFEGFRPTLYNDPAGHCTIGYGFLVHLGNCDDRESEQPYTNGMTEPQARDYLHTQAAAYAAYVTQFTTRPLNQNQFDAMTSFCYNVGPGGYRDSTVLAAINRGDLHQAAANLDGYVRGTDGVTYPGLVRRRGAEAALFNEPMEAPMPLAPTTAQLINATRIFLNGADHALRGIPLPDSVKAQLLYLLR